MPLLSKSHTTMKELMEDKALRQLAPILFNLPKQDPFVVEGGFFEQFPYAVQALAAQPSPASPAPWIKRAAIALPALALLTMGIWSWWPTDGPTALNPTVPQLTMEEFQALALDPGPLAPDPETFTTSAPWDHVEIQLTEAEALAYIDREQISMYDLLQYLQPE